MVPVLALWLRPLWDQQLKHFQVEARIKNFMYSSILSKLDTSTSLKILITWFQLVASISRPILEKKQLSLTYINSVWTNGSFHFLNKYNAKVKIKLNYCSTFQRYNDSFIMDEIHSITLPHSDLQKINVCRL